MILDRHEMASVHNAPRLPEGSLSVLVGRHGTLGGSGAYAIRALPDLCLGIVSGRLEFAL
jgi:hypothetical protein